MLITSCDIHQSIFLSINFILVHMALTKVACILTNMCGQLDRLNNVCFRDDCSEAENSLNKNFNTTTHKSERYVS